MSYEDDKKKTKDEHCKTSITYVPDTHWKYPPYYPQKITNGVFLFLVYHYLERIERNIAKEARVAQFCGYTIENFCFAILCMRCMIFHI